MPISLLPSRRSFLAATLAGTVAGGSLLARGLHAEAEASHDSGRFALLADTHIPSDATISARNVNMAENLRSVVKQLLAFNPQPQAALVIGDCAYLEGKAEDYKLFSELLAPLVEAKLPLHLCLGNHDDRQNCLKAFTAADADLHTKVERRVAIVPSKFANWYLLDSLDAVNKTPGLLGKKQLDWLAAALDANPKQPALIAVHHHLTPLMPTADKVPGLVDTPALLELVKDRPQVKAIFFGHTHVWDHVEHQGIHLVNLPPVAYVFGAEMPNGWVDCQLTAAGATLKLLCHDEKHARHEQTLELAWRLG